MTDTMKHMWDQVEKALEPFARAASGKASVGQPDSFLIWQDLTVGDLRRARDVLRSRAQTPAATPQEVQEACAQVADRTALRCVREQIPGDSVAQFIAKAIRALIPPADTSTVQPEHKPGFNERMGL